MNKKTKVSPLDTIQTYNEDIEPIKDSNIQVNTKNRWSEMTDEEIDKYNDVVKFVPTSIHNKLVSQKGILRNIVATYADVQKLRISVGNRIYLIYLLNKDKLNKKASNLISSLEVDNCDADLTLEEKQKRLTKINSSQSKFLSIVLNDYKSITTDLNSKECSVKKYFSSYIDKKNHVIITLEQYMLITQYFALTSQEKMLTKLLESELANFPIYTNYLSKIQGVGVIISSYLLAFLDVYKTKYYNGFWKYCGLDVVPVLQEDGSIKYEGRVRKKTHKENIVVDGKEVSRLPYNVELQGKLLGILAPSLIRTKNPKYYRIYLDYRARLDSSPKHIDKSTFHKSKMAYRYIVKLFLMDFWKEWRLQEGLPIPRDYTVAVLGKLEHKAPNVVMLSDEEIQEQINKKMDNLMSTSIESLKCNMEKTKKEAQTKKKEMEKRKPKKTSKKEDKVQEDSKKESKSTAKSTKRKKTIKNDK